MINILNMLFTSMFAVSIFKYSFLMSCCNVVGMDGTKHQSMFQPTEESGLSTRALPSHDFCDSRLYVTPSAYRFMSHEVKDVDGKTHLHFQFTALRA